MSGGKQMKELADYAAKIHSGFAHLRGDSDEEFIVAVLDSLKAGLNYANAKHHEMDRAFQSAWKSGEAYGRTQTK